jgi:arylsulfatase A-like enzyme
MNDRDGLPNILVLHAHDLGRHLRCYGVDTVDSPRLDGLAGEGVLFEQAFCTAPQCSPSRATIFTGRWPHCTGVLGLCHDRFGWELNDDELHLAQVLGAAGYRTVGAGVIHETARPGARPGFDELLAAAPRAAELAPAVAERITQLAADDRPFYMQAGFFEPHRPLPEGDPDAGAFVPAYLHDTPSARAEFDGFQRLIRRLDDGVGTILDALQRTGRAENTIVCFVADHGIPFPRAKCSLYDPGLAVALMLRWPAGGVAGGARIDTMSSLVDLMPTLLDLAGVDGPDRMHGRSFAPLIRGQTHQPRDAIFAQITYHDYYDPLRAIRTDRHKLIVSFVFNRAFMDPSQTWIRATCPVVPADPVDTRHELVELYDLHPDPLEHDNLARAPEHAQTRRELLDRLHRWMVETGDPLLIGVPPAPNHAEALAVLRGE